MSEEGNGAGKGVVSSALLVAAVAAILVAGMILRTGGPTQAPHRAAGVTSPAPSPPLGSTVTPEPQPAAPPAAALTTAAEPALAADPVVAHLAARAKDDCGRLAKAGGRWTAQLIVACKPQTVDRLLEAARGSTRIYVLPASVKDDACFRVCFGAYATSKDAARAADLPNALRGKERIGAVEIAKVLP